MAKKSSRIAGFYKKTSDERLQDVRHFCGLSDDDMALLRSKNVLDAQTASRMIENFVAFMPMPMGIATNFSVNGKDYLIPMVIEEPSVVAAACHAAKLTRLTGGFRASSGKSIMIGQMQFVDVKNTNIARRLIEQSKQELIEQANECDQMLIAVGGGAVDLAVKDFQTHRGSMLVVYLHVDVCDAMGGNAVNTMVESLAMSISHMIGSRSCLKIVSNLPLFRLVKVAARWCKRDIGYNVVQGILDADALAAVDPFRAATHNKGIMNGIDAVSLATGNDFRAIEAGAHSFASYKNEYRPLSRYKEDECGDLIGELEIPLAVGIIGGVTQSHPITKIALKILGAESASVLAEVMAAVGLAQNFAALRALVSEGIQKGHMKLHSRNIAIQAGATVLQAEKIAGKMVREGNINVMRARQILEKESV